jgi:hypothetical protein
MEINKQIRELIQAQDIIRRVYSEQSKGVLNEWLKEVDKELTKIINGIRGMINK